MGEKSKRQGRTGGQRAPTVALLAAAMATLLECVRAGVTRMGIESTPVDARVLVAASFRRQVAVTELPGSLARDFRVIAMPRLNWEQIAEVAITLQGFAYGFPAKSLAQRIARSLPPTPSSIAHGPLRTRRRAG